MIEAQALRLLIPPTKGQDTAAAIRFLARRQLHAGTASTLRKANRAQRIAARKRPLAMPRIHETVLAEHDGFALVGKRELHPTKGWRKPD